MHIVTVLSSLGELAIERLRPWHVILASAKLAQITYTRHKVSIGVFTLQGYERRNKESKNVFVKHSNSKGNLCCHTIKGF